MNSSNIKTLRARAEITPAPRVSMRPAGKERGVEHSWLYDRRVTLHDGMQRRSNADVISARALTLLCICGLTVGASACVNREIAAVDPHTGPVVVAEIHQTGTTKVDILFVIDNSASMDREQEILADQIVLMARELIHPTDPTDPVVEDLHIGIVTTDMGTGGYTIQTCSNSMSGDNGVLQSAGRLGGCEESYLACDIDRGECPWLFHSEERPDDGTNPEDPPIWDDFGCIATLGTEGCGFEQQLEASLVALTVQSEAGRPNEGFLREDSLLAIIYVTDEDDCSTPNAEMFNPSRDDLGNINVRCALHSDELYPVERYVNGFKNLRPGREDNVVVAAITGVPIDGTWDEGDSLQALRDMQVVDPNNSHQLLPSCDTGMGYAYPPVRIAELVYAFGDNGILESICRSDWTPALQAITRTIVDHIPGACMDRELASTSADACNVIETLTDDRACPHLAEPPYHQRTSGWHENLGVNDDGQRMCKILPADYDGDSCPDGVENCQAETFSDGLQGWFYSSTNPECDHGEVRFTDPGITSDGSRIRIECRTALCPERRQCFAAADSEADCDPNDASSCGPESVCVRHISGEVCGWTTIETTEGEELRPMSCAKCSPTIGAQCSAITDSQPREVWEAPLVDMGGCCAEGFHCDGGQCAPDRTTACR